MGAGRRRAHQTLLLNTAAAASASKLTGIKPVRACHRTLLWAEEYGFARSARHLGLRVMLVCHLTRCRSAWPQDPRLREKFKGDPQTVVNFMLFVAREARELMAELGFRTVNEMVGHTECIEMRADVGQWKARGLDFSQMLYRPEVPEHFGRHWRDEQITSSKGSENDTSSNSAALASRGSTAGVLPPVRQPRRRRHRRSEVTRASAREGCRTTPSACTSKARPS